MKNRKLAKCSFAMAAGVLLSGAAVMQSCEKDILTGQPERLGNSIYERLQVKGNYGYTLRLIDDLGQTDVLSQTGSKTLFVADDDAYRTFFGSNSWGVSKYEDLSLAQKKMLFNSAMINNAFLVELLSSVSGTPPLEGECMRRLTAVSVYDSVPRISAADMPNTPYWKEHKDAGKSMLLLRDNSAKPMIHFLPLFMEKKSITDDDLQLLTNGASQTTADAWVNGKKIIERDIVCKNGYIHRVDGVMTSADNMAEIIAGNPRTQTFKRLLNRFSAPYKDEEASKEYNRIYGTEGEEVYTQKYFVNNGDAQFAAPDGSPVDATLLFDPGWNQYMYTNTSGRDLHYDAGAMLVPSDEALANWWDKDGKVLQDMYGTWDNVPLTVLSKLLNNCMINSFSETVPSKFDHIVDNTTKVKLGVEKKDILSCQMGCNGVVYLTDKVFPPADYSSVAFPALVRGNSTMSVIYWGISNLNFEPYLNSMDSYYSFFLPSNKAMLNYIDPCSYGSEVATLYQFYFDPATKTVKAHRVGYDLATQTVRTDKVMDDASSDQVSNRLNDLIENLIVVGNVESGHTYYKTKGGSILKVSAAGQQGKMTVSGGLQVEMNQPLVVDTIYDQSEAGNGKTYNLDGGMPLASRKSVYATLKGKPEFSGFFNLMMGSKLFSQKLSGKTCADYNVALFDAYNYTVYVPGNSVISQLQADGILPTWDDYESLTAEQFGGDAQKLKAAQTLVSDRINNFLRYHFQDNSVTIGGMPTVNVKYETFKINPANKRFFSLTVSADDEKLTLEDQLGNKRRVVTEGGRYNSLCREYWIQTKNKLDYIFNASDAVVHEIDGALFYEAGQLTKWRDELNKL